MPNAPYKGLPLDALYEQLVSAVSDLLEALENKEEIAIEAKKRQCELIHNSILVSKDIARRANSKPGSPL